MFVIGFSSFSGQKVCASDLEQLKGSYPRVVCVSPALIRIPRKNLAIENTLAYYTVTK